jgi:hypothetical protein
LKINLNHKFLIVDEPVKVDQMQKYLDSIIDNNKRVEKKNASNLEDKKIIDNQLQCFKAQNTIIENRDNVNKNVYLLLLYTKENELHQAVNELNNVSLNSKIQISRIDNKQDTCRILNQFYCPYSDLPYFDFKQPNGINKDLGTIEFNDKSYKLNNQFTQIIDVLKCPTLVTAG